MIDELIVANLGVIESGRLEPGPGLTVVTGETGTGKTLLVGALRLLLGYDAKAGLVGPFGDEAVAEGRFILGDGTEVGATRRLPRGGRSRAYLDGSIASAKALDERIAGVVDLIGQHDHLSLTRPTEARELVDRSLDQAGSRALSEYERAWGVLVAAEAAREELGGDRAALARELDLVSFQASEIATAGFEEGDAARLEVDSTRLRRADDVIELLSTARERIEDAREPLGLALDEIRRAARIDPSHDHLEQDCSGFAEGLTGLTTELRHTADGIDSDPETLMAVEERLTLLGDLRRKYGRTIGEVLEFGAAAAERRDQLSRLLDRADAIDEEVEAAVAAVAAAAGELTEARRSAALRLESAARTHLLDLGFSDPLITVAFQPAAPTRHGADVVELLFASDSRLVPAPVATVASGGELSRLVLALRLAGGRGEAETLVFDEIDAGVGGATALALGRKLAALSVDRQVLCVTHLPQVAAFASKHYVVIRRENTATVSVVDGDGRLEELSRMLAGLPASERGRDAAEELLELASP
ncbi:AAA family ATPase [soil metagenome]